MLVVEAADVQDRAVAFVGHNQDRLPITAIQMHRAKIAAGDPDALTAQQVLDRAGAVLVVGAYGQRGWKPGETVTAGFIEGFKAQSRNTNVDEAAMKRDFDVSRQRYLSGPWRATR